jgi:uncharacterized membrane protein YtjA (UPF0391 family)
LKSYILLSARFEDAPYLCLSEACATFKLKPSDRRREMLYWAVICLIVAIIAGVLGFGGIAGTAAGIAKVLFFIFLILLVVSLVANAMKGKGPKP